MSDITELMDKFSRTKASTVDPSVLYRWMIVVTDELTALRAENVELRDHIQRLDSRTTGSVLLG